MVLKRNILLDVYVELYITISKRFCTKLNTKVEEQNDKSAQEAGHPLYHAWKTLYF